MICELRNTFVKIYRIYRRGFCLISVSSAVCHRALNTNRRNSPASLAPLTCPHQFSKLFASLVFLAKKDSHPQISTPSSELAMSQSELSSKTRGFSICSKSPSLCWRGRLVQTNPSSKTISFLKQNQPQVFHFQLPHSFFSDSPALRSRGVSSWHHDFRTQQG